MLIQRDIYSPTYCYAVSPSSFEVLPGNQSARALGLCFKKEKSVPTVSYGKFHIYNSNGLGTNPTFADMLQAPSLLFYADFKWDNRRMWSSDEDFRKEMEMFEVLNPLFHETVKNGEFVIPTDFALPEDFEGWFQNKKK